MAGILAIALGCSQKHVEPVIPDPLTVQMRAIQQDQHVPSKVFFDANVQGGMTPYAYEWTFGDEIGSTDLPQPQHTYTTVGEFRVVCKVKSGDGQIVADTQFVTTIPQNQLTAQLTAIPPIGQLPFTATLLANASGGVSPYVWAITTLAGDTIATEQTAQVTPTKPGTYVYVLTVQSDDGQVAKDTAEVVATNESVSNIPPVAVMTITPLNGVVNSTVFTFSSSGSYDPDGSLKSITWDFGDGSSANGATASHVYSDTGLIRVTMCVTDDSSSVTCKDGYVLVTTETVIENKPPRLSMSVSPINGIVNVTTIFCTADGSYDSDGTVVDYVWSFGDGQFATGKNVAHVYASAGLFEITCTITDDDAARVSEHRWVLIGTSDLPHPSDTCWIDSSMSLQVTSKPSESRRDYTLNNPSGVFWIALKIKYEKPNMDLILGFEAKYQNVIQSEVIADPKPGVVGNYTAIVILNGQFWMNQNQPIAFTFQAGPNANKAQLLGVYACSDRETLLGLK